MENLSQYFEREHQFYLNCVEYKRIEELSGEEESEVTLNCTDNISATVHGTESVDVILSRRLSFDPEQIFSLEVSFGAHLVFNKEKAKEINWHEIELAAEFRKNGEFVLQNLSSRISLLVAQITSSFGQTPLILPPNIPQNE